jgi:hypothetical protein
VADRVVGIIGDLVTAPGQAAAVAAAASAGATVDGAAAATADADGARSAAAAAVASRAEEQLLKVDALLSNVSAETKARGEQALGGRRGAAGGGRRGG